MWRGDSEVVVIGVGGYASGPVLAAASMLGIKTAILEQNAHVGLANKILARRVDRAYLSFAETAPLFDPSRARVVGNPVRRAFVNAAYLAAVQAAGGVPVLLPPHLDRRAREALWPRLDGILRHLVVRTTSDDREAMALVVVTRNDRALRAPLRAFLRSADAPDSLYVTVHDRDDPFMLGDRPLHIHGPTHLRESIAGVVMRLSPSAFFQT